MKGYYAFFVLALVSLACMESVPAGAGITPAAPSTVAVGDLAQSAGIDDMIVENAGLPIFEPAAFDVRTVCAIEFLNVRGGPDAQIYNVLYQLAAGERVRVREWSNGWAMVSRLDYVPPYTPQWVNGDYLCNE